MLSLISSAEEMTVNGSLIGASQDRLSKLCLLYLSTEALLAKASIDVEETIERYRFLEYATRNWLVRAERAERCGIGQEHIADILDSRPSMIEIWKMIHNRIDVHDRGLGCCTFASIHVGSVWNLQTVVRRLLQNGAFIDKTDITG